MSHSSIKLPVAVLFVLLLLGPSVGTTSAARSQDSKVRLTHDVYDSWRSLRGATLSDDGRWLLYAEVPGEGDAELVVRNLETGSDHRQGLGWMTSGTTFVRRAEAEFTADSRFVVYLAKPGIEALKAARKDEKKPDQMPKKTLGILNLATGEAVTVDRVKSFALPEEAGGWLAYLKDKPLEDDKAKEGDKEPSAEGEGGAPEATESKPEPAQEEPSEEENDDKEKDKEKDYGTELAVRSLSSGEETSIASVMQMQFADDGSRLFYTVSSKEEPDTDGVYARDLADGSDHALLMGKGNYKRLTINEEQTRIAFMTDRNDYEADEPVFELYGMEIGESAASVWVSHTTTSGFPDGFAVSDKEAIRFTDDGTMVMFGIKERPEPEPETDAEATGDGSTEEESEEEKAKFDLWHWNDPYPQPRQLEIADEVNDEAFESVYHIAEGRFVQLADEDLPDVELSDNGAIAMGTTDRAWAKRASYEGSYEDVILVDPRTGERRLVAERVSWDATLSPDGRYVSWYGGAGDWIGYDSEGRGGWSGGQRWFLYDVAAGTTRDLTAQLDVSFERRDWDTPNLAAPYGSAGFTADEQAVLIYDEFDIWAFPTGGGEARTITEGFGREHGLSFRTVKTDPDQDAVPVDTPVLLRATDQETMATSFWADRVEGDATPAVLLAAEASLSFVDLADGADTMVFTRQTFSEFPDLWVGQLRLGANLADDGDLESALTGVRKVTELGSQTDRYLWGRAELRDFRSSDGLPLKGILIKPEDFDPDKQYPLMVYIYETLHQGLHRFRSPSPGTSINPSYYVSNGYVLWMPDIEYVTPGYPGKDALKCVLPGINMLLDEGYIDAEGIGIQGHSWGGYQIAYMVTQTGIFKAAESGAPVSNMTSAYGGIRWGSGLVRQFQYERTQSRLGASLWEVPLRYIENSPLFWADKIDTPLLIIHNDNDGAVPWYQGIEFIMALRRLGKEAYMYNYNGEEHGLRKRVNQKDWTVRMQQFFDHHLRGVPAPEWMTKGIRGWEKGEVDR